MSLASEIKNHKGTELAEHLCELKLIKAQLKKGHLLKKIWLIDISTYVGGKIHDKGCGFSPCFFGSIKDCESAIRACGASIYKELEKNKQNPRLQSSYNSDKIAKGAVRVYYKEKATKKDSFREFRPICFNLADSLDKAKDLMCIGE